MGQLLIKALDTEIKNLKTDKVRNFVKEVLESCNDANAVGPASASGKYHPTSDLGEGGLIRHTKIVCRNVATLLRTLPNYDTDSNWDVVYASAILHDMCKFTSDDVTESNMAHPVDMAAKIRELNKEKDADFERIADNVSKHMSRWNDVYKYVDGKQVFVKKMPTPTNVENLLVSFADMIGSQKWFKSDFDEKGDLI
jgi:hypothetical protein